MRETREETRRRLRAAIKWALYAAIFLLFWLCQEFLFVRLPLFGLKPDFVPIFVVVVALFEGSAGGAVFGLVAGLVADYQNVRGDAFFAVALLLIGAATGAGSAYLLKKNIINALLLSLAASGTVTVLFYLLFYLLPGRAGPVAFVTAALPQIVYSVAFAPLVYLLCRTVWRRFGEERPD